MRSSPRSGADLIPAWSFYSLHIRELSMERNIEDVRSDSVKSPKTVPNTKIYMGTVVNMSLGRQIVQPENEQKTTSQIR
ncbi:unnamed protein product [Caenorhabditis brenneri]